MEAMTQTITYSKLTFEEYLELPHNGQRVELVNGELVELTPPREEHHQIQDFLYDAMRDYARQRGLDWKPSVTGRGVQVSADNSYIPDLVVSTAEQRRSLRAMGKASVFPLGNPPLLVVEVISPSTKKKDTEDKLAGYALAKVPEYWMVNPVAGCQSVAVYVLQGSA